MSSEALGKTVIKGDWQSFSKKLLQHFIHHKKALKVTKFRSRVLDKNIPLWYIVPPPTAPDANRVNHYCQIFSAFYF